MTIVDTRTLFAIAAAALLTACGGSATDTADPHAATAALVVQVNAPVADCEAEGCNRPRIVDGLAEQYRAAAIEQPADQGPAPGEPAAR